MIVNFLLYNKIETVIKTLNFIYFAKMLTFFVVNIISHIFTIVNNIFTEKIFFVKILTVKTNYDIIIKVIFYELERGYKRKTNSRYS